MADQLALRARRSELWIWLLVIAATASVVALAVMQGRREPMQLAAKPVPRIALPLLGGGKASLPLGKVTVVDFWAVWCRPCRYSMPRVQQLWKEYGPRGVELYSVDTDDPAVDREREVQKFLTSNSLTFPVVLDDGSASEAFGVASLPTMLLLDRSGNVVWKHVGSLSDPRERDLRAAIDRALQR
jgi:thiol-disulfide isomerase/thioredoxin